MLKAPGTVLQELEWQPKQKSNCQNSGLYVDRLAYQLHGIAVGSSPLHRILGTIHRKNEGHVSSLEEEFISLEGGITLIKAAFYQTPVHYLSVFDMPSNVTELYRVMDFLWSSKDAAGAHLVGWTKVTKLVEEGGLGLGRLKGKYSPLREWLWRFLLELGLYGLG